jgi:hypothetical protein
MRTALIAFFILEESDSVGAVTFIRRGQEN